MSETNQTKFLFPISFQKTPSQWAKSLANLGFSKISQTNTDLTLYYTLAEDAHGAEYESIRIKITKNSLELEILGEPKNFVKRKLEGLKLSLLVISILKEEEQYSKLFAAVVSLIEEATALIDFKSILVLEENNKLKEENNNLNKKLQIALAEKENLTKQLMQHSIKISELNTRLQKLLEIPDEVIQDELLEWLKAHNGEINISEFCIRYSCNPQRALENLDKLAKMGKISRVQ
ncbi:MAG: hypothetical protein N3D10_00250 [Candidatus Micrarchaeota archaeon]|nr:hypothetical protein [Candidatus Micrarchaeota archaeon]